MCESPTVEPITQPSSGPTQPASSTENGIIYWIMSAVIITLFTCIIYMIITKTPAQQKQSQGEDTYIIPPTYQIK